MVLYLVVVTILLLTDASAFPKPPRFDLPIPADKIVHFLLFTPFPVLAYLSVKKDLRVNWKSVLVMLLVFAIGCVFAVLSELAQSFTPTRTTDIDDVLADGIGMLCSSVGTIVILLFRHSEDNLLVD